MLWKRWRGYLCPCKPFLSLYPESLVPTISCLWFELPVTSLSPPDAPLPSSLYHRDLWALRLGSGYNVGTQGDCLLIECRARPCLWRAMRGVDPDSEGSPSKVLWSLRELLWGHMLWGEKKLPGFSPALGFLQPLDVLVLSEAPDTQTPTSPRQGRSGDVSGYRCPVPDGGMCQLFQGDELLCPYPVR